MFSATMFQYSLRVCPCRLLNREGVRVCHVPDVALALTGTYNSTISMLTAKATRQSTNEVRPVRLALLSNELSHDAST